MLTQDKMDEIKSRRSKATYAPWSLERDIMGSELDICGTATPESGNPVVMAVILGDDEDGNTDDDINNGKFIAKAPEDIDLLIAEVERQRLVIESLVKFRDDVGVCCHHSKSYDECGRRVNRVESDYWQKPEVRAGYIG